MTETTKEITRESCLECAEKHLGSAWVILEKSSRYKNILLAVGHLHEAEDETQEYPELHSAIRDERKLFQETREKPDFSKLNDIYNKVFEGKSSNIDQTDNISEYKNIRSEYKLIYVEKHIGSAWVLLTESREEYKHDLLAIGHLNEALEHSKDYSGLHSRIKQETERFQQTRNIPRFELIAEQFIEAFENSKQEVVPQKKVEQSKNIEKAKKHQKESEEEKKKRLRPCFNSEVIKICCGGKVNVKCLNENCPQYGQVIKDRYCKNECPILNNNE